MALRNLLGILAGAVAVLLSLPVFAAVLPFVFVSRLSRWVSERLEPRFEGWADLIEFDPLFGWKPRADLNAWHLADDVFRVTTDADGWRGRQRLEDADVVALGDSFAWGFGIDDRDFFGDLREEPRVKAIGTVGYSQVHEVLWLEQNASRLRGKTVVWLLYYGNDLYDNLSPHMYGYRSPFVRENRDGSGWEIETGHITSRRWFFKTQQLVGGRVYLEQLADLCRPGHFATRAFAACRYLLERGQRICREAGAELIVVSVPEKSQYDRNELATFLRSGSAQELDPHYPDRQLAAMCKELGLPFVAVMEQMDLRHFKERDCHWNSAGHATMADLIARLHRDHADRDAPQRVPHRRDAAGSAQGTVSANA